MLREVRTGVWRTRSTPAARAAATSGERSLRSSSVAVLVLTLALSAWPKCPTSGARMEPCGALTRRRGPITLQSELCSISWGGALATAPGVQLTDEERLAELGYKQDLERRMSGFQNFAISFTIISILSGALTLYYQGINYGGPQQEAIGWPIVSVFVLIVGVSMAELASAYPTAGGLYWWASRLGGPAWGWFTGWFNLIGQVAITAGIDYGAATFTTALLGLLFDYNTDNPHIIYVYAVILAAHALLNILNIRLVGVLNHVSAYWHVVGVAVIALVLIFVPDQHESASFVFTKTLNNSGLGG